MTLDLRAIGGSALTAEIAVPKGRDEAAIGSGIPVTYVPARNTIFLAYAIALAEVREASEIVVGVNVLDSSGYPDCRPEWLAAMQEVARLGTKSGVERRPVTIRAPLIKMSKAEIIRAGIKLGVDYGLTHSCYDPVADGRGLRRLRLLPAAPPRLRDRRRRGSDALRVDDYSTRLQGPPKAPPPEEAPGGSSERRGARGRRCASAARFIGGQEAEAAERAAGAAGGATASGPPVVAAGRWRAGLAPIAAAIAAAVPIVVDVDELGLLLVGAASTSPGAPSPRMVPSSEDGAAGERRVGRLGVERRSRRAARASPANSRVHLASSARRGFFDGSRWRSASRIWRASSLSRREGRSRSSAGAIACATSWPTSRTPLLSGSSASRSGGSSSAARMRAFDGATGRAAVERSSAAR